MERDEREDAHELMQCLSREEVHHSGFYGIVCDAPTYRVRTWYLVPMCPMERQFFVPYMRHQHSSRRRIVAGSLYLFVLSQGGMTRNPLSRSFHLILQAAVVGINITSRPDAFPAWGIRKPGHIDRRCCQA